MRNPRNGDLLDRVMLKRIADGIEDKTPITSISLAGYDDTVIVNFKDTYELVALKIDFSQITKQPLSP
jgi:hypothetical protein